MKRNPKDKEWNAGRHINKDCGYKRHKMKKWHTEAEARALDKQYNHNGHKWGMSVDWTKVNDTLKKFHNKPVDKFFRYVHARTKTARRNGWKIQSDMFYSGWSYWQNWAWIDGDVLRAPHYAERKTKHPKVIKATPQTGKVFMYKFNEQLLKYHPWILNVLENKTFGCAHIFRRLKFGGEINQSEWNKLEEHLQFHTWQEQLHKASIQHGLDFNNYNIRRHYGLGLRTYTLQQPDYPVRRLVDLFTKRDVTEYIVLERGTKECQRYFGDREKKRKAEIRTEEKERMASPIWEEDLARDNRRKKQEKAQERWEKTKANFYLIPKD